MRIRETTRVFAALLFALPLALTSRAAMIRNVAITSVSSEYVLDTDQRRATNLVNGCGLFGNFHTTAAEGDMWLTLPTTDGAYSNAFVVFDLGSVHTLDQMRVWNYNEAGALTQRGIQRADVFTSTDGVAFTTNFPNTFFDRAPGVFTNFGQTISLSGVSARYVGFQVITNHYVSGTAENRVGLSKVLFYDTNVAPVITVATRSFSNDRVTVVFSDAVSPAGATNAANYAILLSGTNAATISSAAFDSYPNRIVLQTSVLNSNLVYTVRATNITDSVTGVAVDPAPAAIEAELALWLQADAGVTADGSGLVSQWNDQSGAGNHALQTNPVYQPMRVAGVLNGQPVLRFNSSAGLTNYLEVAHAPSLTVRSDFSVFAVVTPQDFANFNGILGKTAAHQPAPIDFYLARTSGNPRVFRGNGSANTALAGLSNVLAGQTYIVSGVARGTNLTAYLNGAFNGSVLAMAGIMDQGGPLKVGSRADFVTKLTGDLAEVILIRGAVSDTERAAINGYLGAKYGITVVNLAFTRQPTNTTRLEGQTATFTVAVVSSSPTINYQWQRYGTNLPSATNTTYTTPLLTLADNNSTFRVQVAIPGASQFSDTATLVVLPDDEPPTVVSARRRIWNQSEIVVDFSEAVSPATATNAANYTLDNGANVASAAMGDAANKVVLTASGIATNGGPYLVTIQNVKDLFTNTINAVQVPVGFTPAPALWLSASAGPLVDHGGYITNWSDLSGNANTAIATMGAPFTARVITNGFNGQPVARFDGTNSNFMFINSSPSLAIVGDLAIYVVASFVDYVNFNGLVGKTTAHQPASYDFYLAAGSGDPRLYRGAGGAGSQQAAAAIAPSLGSPHIVSVVMEGTSVAHYLDGLTNGTATITPILGDNGDRVGIGTRNDQATNLKGDIAELFVFGFALGAADRAALDDYFGTKYGIPIGTRPAISIARGPGGSVVLRWPTPAQPFVLESATNVVAAPWVAVTNSVNSSGGTNSTTVTATGSQQFFRLHKQ